MTTPHQIEVGTSNLIPFSAMPRSQFIQMAKNGGRRRTPAKKDAAKFREMRKRMVRDGVSDEDIKYFEARLLDRDMAAADVIRVVEQMGPSVHPAQRVAWLNTLIQALKFMHGEKIKTESVNYNINQNIEDWEKRFYNE